jgi:hypothetical protein
MGLDAEAELLRSLGLDVEMLDSGCCGMAGSFGFEADHYELSTAVGERRLLPAVRDAPGDALIVADGFSCKTQIAELTDRRALHTAQVLAMARDEGPGGPAGRPEDGYPDVEPARLDRRALAAGAAISAAAAGAGVLMRRARSG